MLRGKVVRQVVVDGIFGQPLQRMHWRLLTRQVCTAGGFNVHNERPVPRQVHGVFRHDYLAVEMCAESDHVSDVPSVIMPETTLG